jgi:hypothetical protein
VSVFPTFTGPFTNFGNTAWAIPKDRKIQPNRTANVRGTCLAFGSDQQERKMRKVLMAIGCLFLVAQLIRFERTNPPVTSDVPARPEEKAMLRRACYDCHSNETVWPWYSAIAPVSWLVTRDVRAGRDELNFSAWTSYTTERLHKKLKETIDTLNEGEMPPWYYTLIHPTARLAEVDRAALKEWAVGLMTNGAQSATGPDRDR